MKKRITPSILEKILAAGQLAVTSECGPPRGSDPGIITKKADIIKEHVDAINVTDNQTAMTRLCSLASVIHLKSMGLEPVLQIVVGEKEGSRRSSKEADCTRDQIDVCEITGGDKRICHISW